MKIATTTFHLFRAAALVLLSTWACLAQPSDIVIKIMKGDRAVIAVPDLRGSGDAQAHMGVFNRTLFSDLQDSGYFNMAPKSMYPVDLPQQPQDFKPPKDRYRVYAEHKQAAPEIKFPRLEGYRERPGRCGGAVQ